MTDMEYKDEFNELFFIKDRAKQALEDAEGSTNPVLVTSTYNDILRAYPIIGGKVRLNGKFGNSFIFTSDDKVMQGYQYPIRLMDKFEEDF